MTDWTVQVMIGQDGELPIHPQNGDVQDVFTAKAEWFDGSEYRRPGGVGSRRLAFIHVTDVPADIDLSYLTEELVQEVFDGGEKVDEIPLRFRKYLVSHLDAEPADIAAIQAGREITRPWSAFSRLVHSKSVIDTADPSSDIRTAVY